MQPRYTDYASFLRRFFAGKVQKLAVNIGNTCPNRDGTIGRGGCAYCNNVAFSPAYCGNGQDVAVQLRAGREFFQRKYPEMSFLAYFQTYTNTYGDPARLFSAYEEALTAEGVVGLVVATRPDCVSDKMLDGLFRLKRKYGFVMMEYGVESTSDVALQRVGRGHDFACAQSAIRRTAQHGLPVGAHLILGLPGQSREELLAMAGQMSALPVDVLKLHQLQVVRGTRLAVEYARKPDAFHLFSADEYADLVVDFLERLDGRIAVERFTSQSPAEMLVAPAWGLKNYEFAELVRKILLRRDTWQGRCVDTPII